MRLWDKFSGFIRRNRPIREEIALGTALSRYSGYPSRGLTPERLADIFREADQGGMLRQSELFEEMEEKDLHLGSVLQTRKLAVSALEYEVTPADESARAEDVAAFVRDVIEGLEWTEGYEVLGFSSVIRDLLDGIGKGFSVSEIIWDVSSGQAVPSAIRWRHQKLFTFDGGDRVLPMPRLITPGEPVRGEELIPDKFIYYRSHVRSGHAPRGGLLRPCAWAYLFKNYGIKDWVIFVERFAQPLRMGKYSPGASEAERKVLRDAVFHLGTDAAAIISEATQIELLESQGKRGSSDIYERLAEYCDKAMSKAVLGHSASSDATPGRLGGESGAREVRQDIIEADAEGLGPTIRAHLIRPVVHFNFGPDAPVPGFRFLASEAEDLQKKAQMLEALTRAGVATIPVSYIHSAFGIPTPEDGEETVKPPANPSPRT